MNEARSHPTAWASHLEWMALSGTQGPGVPEDPPPSLLRPARDGAAPEADLWRAAVAGELPAEGLIDLSGKGPLWSPDRWSAIEVWTEGELCGLHALGRLQRTSPRSGLAILARIRSAIGWHLEHTQPDNATHRPWAAHLFLGHPDPEVDLYGQTLLHNFEAAGRGDRDAAWILADAAREIRIDPGIATRW